MKLPGFVCYRAALLARHKYLHDASFNRVFRLNIDTLLRLSLPVIIMLTATTAAQAAEDVSPEHEPAGKIVIQSRSTGSFKNLLYSVWSRLQVLGTGEAVDREPGTSVATLGMRGARLANRDGQPGWVNTDVEQSEELVRYMAARRYAETGDLDKAVSEFGTFIDTYEDSELRPNALFALGVSQAGIGDYHSGKWTMIDFIDQYPEHPLSPDARALLDEFEVIELLDD